MSVRDQKVAAALKRLRINSNNHFLQLKQESSAAHNNFKVFFYSMAALFFKTPKQIDKIFYRTIILSEYICVVRLWWQATKYCAHE